MIVNVDSMYVVRLLKQECRQMNIVFGEFDVAVDEIRFFKDHYEMPMEPRHSDNNKGRRQLGGTGVVDVFGLELLALTDHLKQDGRNAIAS